MTPDNYNHILVRQKLIDAAEGRLVTVTEEFERAFNILGRYKNTVTVFGSARLEPHTKEYQDAHKLGAALSHSDYAVVTGGGLGIMEAANKGAFEAGGISIGFNIQLPTEQNLNSYTTDHFSFEHFFGRKVALTLQSNAYVAFAGGFGTMDEIFEIITLEQTGKIPRVPIILFGSEFWNPMMEFINKVLNEQSHTISPEDKDLLTISDDIDEVIELIDSHVTDIYKAPEGAQAKTI